MAVNVGALLDPRGLHKRGNRKKGNHHHKSLRPSDAMMPLSQTNATETVNQSWQSLVEWGLGGWTRDSGLGIREKRKRKKEKSFPISNTKSLMLIVGLPFTV
jgi:hypothetical protein